MSLTHVLVGRLAIRGKLLCHRADGSVIKEMQIAEGSSLPVYALREESKPEPPQDEPHNP